MNRSTLVILLLLIAGIGFAWYSLNEHNAQDSHAEHEEPGAHEEETAKGPHGGKLLEDGEFALELTVFEAGLPPEFHVYAYHDHKPLDPKDVNLKVELTRLDGKVDHFSFSPQQDYLRGNGVVAEPHSYDVSVTAKYQGKTYQWQFDNYEGRTQIIESMAGEMGIKTEAAGPVLIKEVVTLTGRIQTDPNQLSRVRARFPGVVKTVRRNLGDVVRTGDVLATINSNESLDTYAIKAPIDGTIVRRDIQVGETTADEPVFIISNLSSVWVELDAFGRDLMNIKAGQSVEIETLDNSYRANGVIDWVSSLASHASQSVRVRVQLANPSGVLRPGQFVRGHVTVADHEAPLAVRQSAIQRFRDFQVVFAKIGDTYEVRMLELGKQNSEWVEVTGGLEAGTQYVVTNSYLIKADIEKSGASHDH